MDNNNAVTTTLSSSKYSFIPCPQSLKDTDVLCGRGKICFNHKGNQRFRIIIKENLNRYIKAITKHSKTDIIIDTIKIIRRNNGSFVKKIFETGGYINVTDFHAVSIISIYLSIYIYKFKLFLSFVIQIENKFAINCIDILIIFRVSDAKESVCVL